MYISLHSVLHIEGEDAPHVDFSHNEILRAYLSLAMYSPYKFQSMDALQPRQRN
jgi:hypothetical protein